MPGSDATGAANISGSVVVPASVSRAGLHTVSAASTSSRPRGLSTSSTPSSGRASRSAATM